MKKLLVLVLVLAALVLPLTVQARGGHYGPPVGPCLFAGLWFLTGAVVSQAVAPVVIAPSPCFEIIPIWGPPRWDGMNWIRDRVGERQVPVSCPERRQ